MSNSHNNYSAESEPVKNTDREIYHTPFNSVHDDSIHVTQGGGIGINVAGNVIVKPLRGWHALASIPTDAQPSVEAMKAAVELEIHAALGRVQTVEIGRMIQKAIDASQPSPAATVETRQIDVITPWVGHQTTPIYTKSAPLHAAPQNNIDASQPSPAATAIDLDDLQSELTDSLKPQGDLRPLCLKAAETIAELRHHSRSSAGNETELLATLVYEAMRFAIWAAGQGMMPDEGEPALGPEDFLYEYSCALEIDDWEGLAEVARDHIRAVPQSSSVPQEEDCGCIGAVIGQHERSCPLSRPQHSGETK